MDSEYECDQRHVELIVGGSGIHDDRAKARSILGRKDVLDSDADLKLFSPDMVTKFQSLRVRINYTAQDRSDIQCAAKD
eukprot:6706012-Pyramimonas_sp.AAC.1